MAGGLDAGNTLRNRFCDEMDFELGYVGTMHMIMQRFTTNKVAKATGQWMNTLLFPLGLEITSRRTEKPRRCVENTNQEKDYILTIVDAPDAVDIEFLCNNLYEFNMKKTGRYDGRRITILLRDTDHQVAGGLYGWTAFDLLNVEILWVRENARGKGYGRRLLLAAEEEALERGCRYAKIDTFSFQALEFYEKMNYSIFGVLEDDVSKYTWYFLKKDLTPQITA
jgi:GNAT superfamily N-acetyltransferase